MIIELDLLYVAMYLLIGLGYGILNERLMDDPLPTSVHMHAVTFLTIALGWPLHCTLWIRYYLSR